MKNQYLLFLIVCLLTGIIAENGQKRVESEALIGGRETNSGEIKYLVSLQADDEHFCGGSIIGDRFILSAAHCVIDDNNEFDNRTIKVVTGINDLQNDELEPVVAEVEKIYVPSSYNDSEWVDAVPLGDIAVLKLNQSLDLKNNPRLKRLRLPRPNKRRGSRYNTYEGFKVQIAGFGWDKVKIKKAKNNTEFEVGSSTDRLFVARAQVISNFECEEFYTHSIQDSELCARVTEHKDSTPQGVCRGDSGGPLVYRSNTIIGVVSGIAIGCNENNEPGIYCRVSSYVKFIRNALKDVTDNMRTKTF